MRFPALLTFKSLIMQILNEQEAAAFMLYSAIAVDGILTEHETKKVASIIVFCKKFKGVDFNQLVAKFFQLQKLKSPVEIIELAAPLIQDDFKKTFFAIICDLLCSDGKTNDLDISLITVFGSELRLSKEDYLPIAYAFMDRYAWNHCVEV